MKHFCAAALLLSGADSNKLRLESEASTQSLELDSSSLRSAYSAFLHKQGTDRSGDSVAYSERLAVFARARANVEKQNSKADRSWTAALTRFADYTPTETRQMLGFRRLGQWWQTSNTNSSSFLQESQRGEQGDFPESVDWTAKLGSGRFFVDQGGCGSCWAVAATGALEMRAEISTKAPVQLSYKELVDCVPNPHHCGGTGGCEGATGELAFQYVQSHGLSSKSSYLGAALDTEATQVSYWDHAAKEGTCLTERRDAHVKASSFVRLPVNKLNPLMEAIQSGPVVVSVDGEPWMMYNSGVFDGCERDATVNHAVLLVGYGHDSFVKKDYWLVRNSWGQSWGEGGFIRIHRHASDQGAEGYCGTDHDPSVGVGCDGGPSTLPVCGMCGILSDSAYPEGVSTN